jgi:outer membrane protein assembly factor BamB
MRYIFQHHVFRFLIPTLLGLAFHPSAHSENWNRFRGPDGTGALKSGKFPDAWTSQEYAWSFKLPGVGHSSPVLWGDKLFTTCASESTGEQFILCLNAKSGKKLWQKSFPSKVYPHHKFNSFASATPCIDHEYVFVSWTTKGSNDLLCLDHDGALVWRRDFGRFQTQHGNGFSPIVEGEVVIVTHDHEVKSSILCLDRKTGRTLWKTDRDGSKPSSSTPLTYRTGKGNLQFVSNSKSHGCYGVDARTGELLWETGPDTLDLRSVSSPVFAEGLFFASCGAGGRGSRLVAIRPPSVPDQKPEIAYVLKKNVPYVPTPLPFGDMLFLISDGGIASCLKTATGEVLWRERLEGNYFASPVLVDERACIVSQEGEVRILSITKEKMEVLGLSKLGEKTYNTPAISPKSIFFRTYSTIHCLNAI